jgi:hypothetical protein
MIINGIGALFMVIGLAAAFAVGGLVDVIWPNAMKGVAAGSIVFFLLASALDLVFRWRNFRERGRWRFFHPFTGGMFFFVPVWIVFGLAPLIAMPVMLVLFPPKKDPPRRVAATRTASVQLLAQELPWNSDNSVRRA